MRSLRSRAGSLPWSAAQRNRASAAADFARDVLAPGGAFLCKVLQGGTEASLLAQLKRDFASVKHVKPAASRSDSAELYLLATGFRGQRSADTLLNPSS